MKGVLVIILIILIAAIAGDGGPIDAFFLKPTE
jgi:hypothetical protein